MSRIRKQPLLLIGVVAIGVVLLATVGLAGLPFLVPFLAVAVPLLLGRFPGEEVLARMRERRSDRRQAGGAALRQRPHSQLRWLSALRDGGAAPRGPPASLPDLIFSALLCRVTEDLEDRCTFHNRSAAPLTGAMRPSQSFSLLFL